MESTLLFRLLAQLSMTTRYHIQLFFCQSDTNYCFTLVDAGHHSDGGVVSNSGFGQAIESENLVIPLPRALSGTSTAVPFVFVRDKAFSWTWCTNS